MMLRGDFLDEAKRTICNDRQDVYGSPENSFPVIAKYWEIYLSGITNTEIKLTARNAADMLALFKLARITTGKFKEDNYIDLCGYAAIAGSLENKNDKICPEEAKDNGLFCKEEIIKESENGLYYDKLMDYDFDIAESITIESILLSVFSNIAESPKEFVRDFEDRLNTLIDNCLYLKYEDCDDKLIDRIANLGLVIRESNLNPELSLKYQRFCKYEYYKIKDGYNVGF